MKTFAALSLSAALLGATAVSLPVSSAQAAPIGAMAGLVEAGKPVVDQVQYRRRVVRRRDNGAALAAGLIGAAVVGGALIAESQRRERAEERAYYYNNGYGYYQQPGYGYYDSGYYAPQPTYVVPRRRYVEPGYYPQPGYGYHPHHHRTMRDPAGGGQLRMGGP